MKGGLSVFVSCGVVEPVRLEPQEIVLSIKEETVDAVTLIPREQLKQWTAEQIGDAPQIREETVQGVNTTLQERISERSEAIKVPKISRQESATESKLTESFGERKVTFGRAASWNCKAERHDRIRYRRVLWWSWPFLGPEQVVGTAPSITAAAMPGETRPIAKQNATTERREFQ